MLYTFFLPIFSVLACFRVNLTCLGVNAKHIALTMPIVRILHRLRTFPKSDQHGKIGQSHMAASDCAVLAPDIEIKMPPRADFDDNF